jgi:hypothetical protein
MLYLPVHPSAAFCLGPALLLHHPPFAAFPHFAAFAAVSDGAQSAANQPSSQYLLPGFLSSFLGICMH